MTGPAAILEARALVKSYGAVRAVRGLDLRLVPGEVHGLIGENGAGKSSLLGMIAGRIRPDSGEILVDGHAHAAITPPLAHRLGIAIVLQELSLCSNMTVAENIHLGGPPVRGGFVLQRAAMRRSAQEVLRSIGADISPDAEVARLRPAEQQLTEIARALVRRARVLILDEPTSSLTHEDFTVIRGVLRSLRAQGVAVLFVSHRLEEVLDLCERVTVMRDGESVATLQASATDERELASLMVGGAVIERRARGRGMVRGDGTARLEVVGASHRGQFEDVSLAVGPGEIVGLAGLRGSGRHELTEAIFGLRRLDAGEIRIDGGGVRALTPKSARGMGITYVPQERRAQALVSVWDVQRNLSLGNLDAVVTRGILQTRRMRAWAAAQVARFGVVPPDPAMPVTHLSGGNQQKVVVARNLAASPRLLILVEPTRGIDVAAKADIASLVLDAASAGAGVLVVDSEVAELLAICDRIYVMHRGRLAGELTGERMNEETIALLSAGGTAA